MRWISPFTMKGSPRMTDSCRVWRKRRCLWPLNEMYASLTIWEMNLRKKNQTFKLYKIYTNFIQKFKNYNNTLINNPVNIRYFLYSCLAVWIWALCNLRVWRSCCWCTYASRCAYTRTMARTHKRELTRWHSSWGAWTETSQSLALLRPISVAVGSPGKRRQVFAEFGGGDCIRPKLWFNRKSNSAEQKRVFLQILCERNHSIWPFSLQVHLWRTINISETRRRFQEGGSCSEWSAVTVSLEESH